MTSLQIDTPPAIDVTRARTALLTLHQRLLQAQRIEVERDTGRMNAGELLMAATQDIRFGWLTPLSELIAELDAARAAGEAAQSEAALGTARTLLVAPDPGTWFGVRYLRALQDHPEVVFAHRDATAALTG